MVSISVFMGIILEEFLNISQFTFHNHSVNRRYVIYVAVKTSLAKQRN